MTRLLAAWVSGVAARAPWVLAAAVLLCALSLPYTAHHLGVNTSTSEMFTAELPWRRAHAASRAAFPQYGDTLLVVIDAPTPELADATARGLAAAIAAEGTLFEWAYAPGADDFFDAQALLFLGEAALHDLIDSLAAAQPVLGRLAADPSLRGLFGLLTDAIEREPERTGFALDVLYGELARGVGAALSGRREPVSWQAITAGQPATPEQRRRYVIARPRLDFDELFPGEEALRRVRALAQSLGAGPEHGVRVRLSGSAALAYEELQSVMRGATLAGVGALVGVALILVWGLGSLRLVACALLSLVVGLIWTAWFAAFAVGHLNLISVAFAVLYIGLGIDYAIHYSLRFRELLRAGEAPRRALETAATDVGGSLVICTVTTGIGFFAFIPTDFSGVSELGLISGTGMFISLFASLTVLPACLAMLPPRVRAAAPRPGDAEAGAWERLGRRPILLATAGLSVVCAALAMRVDFDYNPLGLQDPESESVSTYLELMAEKGRAPWTITVLAEDESQARTLGVRLAGLASVESVRSLHDFLPAAAERKLDLIAELELVLAGALGSPPAAPPAYAEQLAALDALLAAIDSRPAAVSPALDRLTERLRELRARLAPAAAVPAPTTVARAQLARVEENLLATLPGALRRLERALSARALTMADLPAELARRWHSADGLWRLEVVPVEDLNDNDALRRFVDEVRAVAPDAIGTPVINVEASRAVIRAFRDAFLYAALLITVVLAVTFRSAVDVGIVLGLVALGSLIATAALVAAGLSFNFANVIALPMLLGIGVDNGVHVLHRMRAVLPDHGGFLRTSTARAVLVSALTTICSFGNLAFSPHRGMSSMGVLLSLGLGASLLCTLIVLPVVAAWRREHMEGPRA